MTLAPPPHLPFTARVPLPLAAGRQGAVWRLPMRSGSPRSRPHRHEELELNLVTSGTVDVVVDGEVRRLLPGDALWLFPDNSHGVVSATGDWELWIAVITPPMLAALCTSELTAALRGTDAPQGVAPLVRLGVEDTRWVASRLAEASDAGDPARRDAALGLAVLAAWERSCATERAAHQPEVATALRLLDEDPGAWTLGTLADRVGVSSGHLARILRRETGRSFGEHRHARQLARFLALYDRGGHMSATDAAFAAGFGSYAQFHRVFRAAMGCSPSDHRRTVR